MTAHVFALWVHNATNNICDPYNIRRDLRHREWFWDCPACRTTRPARDEDDARVEEARHVCGRRDPEPEPTRRPCKRWTADEDNAVRLLPPDEAAEATGRSRETIMRRRLTLGMGGVNTRWTDAEIATLIQHGPEETAARTGRSRDACTEKLGTLRLRGIAP